MITTTHVLTLNGASDMELPNDQFVEEIVRRAPTLMDGRNQFSISLSRLPEGKRLWDDLPVSWSRLFLQAAGDAEGMIVEVRIEDLDRSDRLYRLVRPWMEDGRSAREVDVPWNGRVDRVPATEVFGAAAAGDIFWHYYQHDAVPTRYELRFLES